METMLDKSRWTGADSETPAAPAYFVATVHLLVAGDETMGEAGASDAISEGLHNAGVADWAYARTFVAVPPPLPHPDSDCCWAYPVEISLPPGEYDEGEFLSHLPPSHRIVRFDAPAATVTDGLNKALDMLRVYASGVSIPIKEFFERVNELERILDPALKPGEALVKFTQRQS